MKYLITLLILLSLSLSAKAEDFNVLWEIDFSPFASSAIVSDEGKYFYYCDSGYVKFHESENGSLLNKFPDRKGLLNSYDTYLNNDRVLLLFSLDSIMIYNISTNISEEIINLNYNSDSTDFFRYVLSPNKRYLSIQCKLSDEAHIIIVDLEQKRLYKDVKLISSIGQIYSTNDPNRMIITDSDQYGTKLMEITIDGSSPFGYKRNIFEEVDTDGKIIGQKYDAEEDAFYYLSLPKGGGHKLKKYDFISMQNTILYENSLLPNENIWFNESNEIFLWENGVLSNIITGAYLRLRPFDQIRHTASSCNGLKTILIREFTSLQLNKLRRVDAYDFLTDVEIENPTNNYLYPNPTTSSLKIELSNEKIITSYKITDASGKRVLSGSLSASSSVRIDVESLLAGVYIIELTTSSGDVVTDKFVKE